MTETAVLLMAYGGPDSLDDVEEFLLDIRGGRPTSKELVEEIRGRYARIGGRSPLLEITRAQAAALEEALNAGEEAQRPRFRTFVGMRHWTPRIKTALAEILDAGIRRVVALCMAPHYSKLSIGAYFAKLDEARQALAAEGRGEVEILRIESWHDHPLFLDAVAAQVRAALAAVPADARPSTQLLFTAHSLPEHAIREGDPYADQLAETAEAVAARLGEECPAWRFCYQSAGASTIPWLGPAIEEVIPEAAAAGHRHVLVAPIGFVADHVEVLFDLDVEAREIAREAGIALSRTASLNARPEFIAALAALVQERVSTLSPRL